MGGAESHHAKDAGRVDRFLARSTNLNVKSGRGGGLNEQGRGSGVEADRGGNSDGALCHG